MKAKIILLALIILSVSFSLFSQDAEELISQGDKLYYEMKDMAAAKEAQAKYQEVSAKVEDKYEAYWRISR
ncbi:MAG: hypothetical protein E3J76_02975, partial [Candidatus Aminicenantes bacterium]